MSTILEMAKDIVIAHAKTTPMTKDELLKEIKEVYASLSALEKGDDDIEVEIVQAEEVKPLMSAKKSIGKNSITCLICGKSMKTLSRHLMSEHEMKATDYRKQFGIARTQALAAKSYSETRKQMAIESGLGEKLKLAREANIAKKAANPKVTKKTSAPKAKKASPTKTKKASAPKAKSAE